VDTATKTQIVIAVLTGIYVAATLVIVFLTFRSLKATRDALALNEAQSKATLDAVHEQIAASELQAQEALYSQHKPIIVPIGNLTSNDATIYTMQIENWGAGVALNTWGILTMKGKPPANIPLSTVLPFRYFFTETHILIPNKPNGVSFRIGEPQVPFRQQILFAENMFEGISIYPLDNKYLVIFDHNDTFGWRQIDEAKRINKRLDEIVVRKDNG